MGVELTIIEKIAVWTLPVLFAITVHEVAHGYVAKLLGDQTASRLGRLTLNPIKHIDLVGTLVVPGLLLALGGFVFGWAKPVPVVMDNLRRPQRDMALVAIAGPLSNLIMALMWAAVSKIGVIVGSEASALALACFYIGSAGVVINLILLVLNLIPIPPLDGSRVVNAFLPGPIAYRYNQVEPYGFFILLGLLILGVLSYVLWPPVIYIGQFISQLFGIPSVFFLLV